MSTTSNTVIIKSIDRDASSTSSSINCKITMPNSYLLDGVFKVGMFQYCNTIKTFSSDAGCQNNIIYFYENSTAKQATIADGIYTSVTIATAVATALNTASGGYNTYTVTLSSTTNKLTISAGSSFFIQNSQDPTGFYSAWRELGFNKGIDTASGTSVTAPNVINLVPSPIIQMQIQEADERMPTSNLYKTFTACLIFPINISYGGYDCITAYNSFDQYVTFHQKSNLTINLIDEDSHSISLQNSDWVLTLIKVKDFTGERPRYNTMRELY